MIHLNEVPVNNSSLFTNTANLWSLAILRVIGYGFLAFFLFDLIETVVPLRLTNPVWEFQTFGTLVEKVPILFLAYGLIYLGRNFGRKRLEKILLPWLTGLVLLLSLLYFLLIPLGVLNTYRLLALNAQQTTQVNTQLNRVQTAQKSLKTSRTAADLQRLLTQDLQNADPLPPLQTSQQFQSLKEQLTSVISTGQTQLQAQAQSLKEARLTLVKKSVKWNLGALISAVLLLYLWKAIRQK
ncbi:MAG: HpsJ family protein [Snowella sp.]|nr:HpsJ family protein [Snowella sp.]